MAVAPKNAQTTSHLDRGPADRELLGHLRLLGSAGPGPGPAVDRHRNRRTLLALRLLVADDERLGTEDEVLLDALWRGTRSSRLTRALDSRTITLLFRHHNNSPSHLGEKRKKGNDLTHTKNHSCTSKIEEFHPRSSLPQTTT